MTFANKIIKALKDSGVQVTRLSADSRAVKSGDVFLAYPGEKNDGRAYIEQAIARGAVAVVWEEKDFIWNNNWNVPHVAVADLKYRTGEIASAVYGDPSHAMRMIGITGTNGKTSCSHWIAECLTESGEKTAVIGTLGNGFVGKLELSQNTTPDAVLLQAGLARYVAHGAQAVAMEVSSIGIDQGRVNGVCFDTTVFTNLTRDHLDYHGSMEAYGAAKAKLFQWSELKHAVINLDDVFGVKLARETSATNVIGYGFAPPDLLPEKLKFLNGSNLRFSTDGLSFDLNSPWGSARVESGLLGAFNASNLLAVIGVLVASGASLDEATALVSELRAVNGRMERVGGGEKPTVVVDYAHTPDALEKTLRTLREVLAPEGMLVCVFGCGGDRDRGKRPLMGEIATRLADRIIITSDNPRSEDPRAIIADIMAGTAGKPLDTTTSRVLAIGSAIESAGKYDIILLAGKGHEEYQEIKGVKMPFSDIQIARVMLENYKK